MGMTNTSNNGVYLGIQAPSLVRAGTARKAASAPVPHAINVKLALPPKYGGVSITINTFIFNSNLINGYITVCKP